MKSIKQLLCVALALFVSSWASAQSYEYDKLNRLKSVTYSNGGGTQTYSYDAAGNLLSLVNTPPAPGAITLTVAVSGGGSGTVTGSGINCGAVCATNPATGATVSLTATAAPGSTFDGWGGACSGTGACDVIMNQSQNVTASFSTALPSRFDLMVSRSGSGSGSISSSPTGISCGSTCSTNFESGTTVTLSATPISGSTFAGWGGNCSGSASCVVTMNAARNVSATFTLNPGPSLSYPLVLVPGWNLLGNSLSQAMPVATHFGNPATVLSVWKRQATTEKWYFYTPELDANALLSYANSMGYGVLSTIEPGEGYWVNAKVAATLGDQTGTGFGLGAAHLVTGWNLVATGNNETPAAFNLSLSAAPPGAGVVPINLTTLWAFENTMKRWFFYAPSLQATGGLDDYITGRGYLDFTQFSKTLGNGTGFWVNKLQ